MYSLGFSVAFLNENFVLVNVKYVCANTIVK